MSRLSSDALDDLERDAVGAFSTVDFNVISPSAVRLLLAEVREYRALLAMPYPAGMADNAPSSDGDYVGFHGGYMTAEHALGYAVAIILAVYPTRRDGS